MESIFFEISIVIIVGTSCAAIAKLLRQPMIPAYILAGILLGPTVFHVIESEELLETLSTFGIAFLLFLVGIELDLRKFLKTGKVAIILGVVQMAFAVGAGYVIIRLMGFDNISAIFLAVALGFSSTILIMKLLGERKELETLYGRIVIGLMLTQDFIAVMFLIFFDVFSGSAVGSELVSAIGFTIVKGFFLFSLALILSRYVLKYVFAYFARSSELLFLGAICWCLIFAMLSMWLGFSIEVGALLAGVSLSVLPYHIEIAHRVKSLRDFFLPIFFAVLGGQLVFASGLDIAIPTIALSALVLIASPVVVIALMLWMGYRSRTSFQTGATIGQVSEFSFIVVSLGYVSGVIERDIVSLTALIGLVTMTLSTYMIEYSNQLYAIFKPVLKRFERKGVAAKLENVPKELEHHIVIFGYSTTGFKVRDIVDDLKKPFIVVDFNPEIIKKLQHEGIPHLYGNMNDEEILEKARIKKADMIISTVPDERVSLALLNYIKQEKLRKTVIVTALDTEDAMEYYQHGASYVLFPKSISADHLSGLMNDNISSKRKKHMKELRRLRSFTMQA